MFLSDSGYQKKLNTSYLIRAVIARLDVSLFSGDDIWNLLRLTWTTRSQSHWRRLKIPALASLFQVEFNIQNDLVSTLKDMNLPESIKTPAGGDTGFSNSYNTYRNSSLGWCAKNKAQLRKILASASYLSTEDRNRVELAATIAKLPRVPSPSRDRSHTAHNLITPLIASIDPLSRFPIINGRRGVKEMLTAFGADAGGLRGHVSGLMEVIGQFGIEDAFYLDTMDLKEISRITSRLSVLKRNDASSPANDSDNQMLQEYDEAERKSILASRTITYRKRHNRITTALKRAFPLFKITQGDERDCRYDALIHNYDGKGRDLLIEAKPDLDKGSFRLAIGQLLDYKRYLSRAKTTDLALLSISSPNNQQVALLAEIGIRAIWFLDEKCAALTGEGKIWSLLKDKYNHPAL